MSIDAWTFSGTNIAADSYSSSGGSSTTPASVALTTYGSSLYYMATALGMAGATASSAGSGFTLRYNAGNVSATAFGLAIQDEANTSSVPPLQ